MIRRRPILRTAVVGGAAYAAGSHAAKKSAEQAQMDAQQSAQIAELQQQQAQQPYTMSPPQQAYAMPPQQQPYAMPPQQTAPPPAPAAPVSAGGMNDEAIARLKQLGELRDAKVLTDEEFEQAKKQVLGTL